MALKIYKSLPKAYLLKYQPEVLTIYNALSFIGEEEEKFQETREAYLGALDIYRNLITDSSTDYRYELGMVLYNLASLYFKNKIENRAREVYLLALEILLSLHQESSNRYREVLAKIFHNLAQIYTSQHEYTDALSAYREALKYTIVLAEEDRLHYAPNVAIIFQNLASFYLQRDIKESAEYFHLKVIDIYTDLVDYDEYTYGVKLASSIIDGVSDYNQHTLTLYHAEGLIRSIYHQEEDIEVEILLEKIYYLRKESHPLKL